MMMSGRASAEIASAPHNARRKRRHILWLRLWHIAVISATTTPDGTGAMKLALAALSAALALGDAARDAGVRHGRRRRFRRALAAEDGLCRATCAGAGDDDGERPCRFTATVDLFAGELGYYRFDECGDVANPTLALEVGRTYEFAQRDPSN